MNKRVCFGIALIVLLHVFVPATLVSQELGFGKWIPQQMEDRFGDPTGESIYGHIVLGEGANSIGRTSAQMAGVMYYPLENRVAIDLQDSGMFGMPLNMLLMG
jgi:hypothetical protein